MGQTIADCPQCCRETPWLPCREAAVRTLLTEREIFRMAEVGSIHSIESAGGSLLICMRSLESRRDNPRTPIEIHRLNKGEEK